MDLLVYNKLWELFTYGTLFSYGASTENNKICKIYKILVHSRDNVVLGQFLKTFLKIQYWFLWNIQGVPKKVGLRILNRFDSYSLKEHLDGSKLGKNMWNAFAIFDFNVCRNPLKYLEGL